MSEGFYDKYENKSPRCEYPFTSDAVGYCWSYAHYVDGTEKFQDIERICKTCDMFNPNPKEL